MKDKTSEILKNVGGFIAVLFLAWVTLSLVASFLQAMNANKDPSVCAKDYYIEYILFTDMFCEVSK
tara:strand:- start:40923 stop:41120 length:198 start_codon:yes stop_codon:yes gene_type:complete